MTGRPSLYSEELAQAFCERMIAGESVNTICKDDGMPETKTIYNWIARGIAGEEPFTHFYTSYVQAREVQSELLVNQVVDIADDDSLDVGFTEDGKPFFKGENVQRSKLKIETRLKYAGACYPRKYGLKQQLELNGKLDTAGLSDEQLASQLKTALALAGITGAGKGNGEEEA